MLCMFEVELHHKFFPKDLFERAISWTFFFWNYTRHVNLLGCIGLTAWITSLYLNSQIHNRKKRIFRNMHFSLPFFSFFFLLHFVIDIQPKRPINLIPSHNTKHYTRNKTAIVPHTRHYYWPLLLQSRVIIIRPRKVSFSYNMKYN